jgi:hypothetical protein
MTGKIRSSQIAPGILSALSEKDIALDWPKKVVVIEFSDSSHACAITPEGMHGLLVFSTKQLAHAFAIRMDSAPSRVWRYRSMKLLEASDLAFSLGPPVRALLLGDCAFALKVKLL